MKILRLTMLLTLLTITSCDEIKFKDLDDNCVFFFSKMVVLCKTYHLGSINNLGYDKTETWAIHKIEKLSDLKILDKRFMIDPVEFQTKLKPDIKRALRISDQVIKKNLDISSKYDLGKQAENIYNLR